MWRSYRDSRRRLAFASRLLWARLRGADRSCPYCGRTVDRTVGRKFLLLEVRHCRSCGLMFAYPKPHAVEAVTYYEHEYRQVERGIVTTLPSSEEVRRLRDFGFRGTPWDATGRLDIIRQIGAPGIRLLDYGCSWGYFVAQARSAGFDATGFEVARNRASFGRESLHVRILDDLADLDSLPDGSFDAICADSVLEHLSDLRGVFPRFHRLLSPGGVLLVFVPNCGGRAAARLGAAWGPFVNEAHTLAFDAEFFTRNLPQVGFTVDCISDPNSPTVMASTLTAARHVGSFDGDELLVIARRIEVPESAAGASRSGARVGGR